VQRSGGPDLRAQGVCPGRGIEPERLRLLWASASEGLQLAEAVTELTEVVRGLGPLNWSANWQENGQRREALESIVKEHEEAMEVKP